MLVLYSPIKPLQVSWMIHYRFLHSFFYPLGSKMCFGAPYKYTHTDRCMDADDTIHAPPPQSYNPYHKSFAYLTRIYTKIGVQCVYLHALGLPPFPWSQTYSILLFSIWGRSFSINQVTNHYIKLIYKCTSISKGKIQ